MAKALVKHMVAAEPGTTAGRVTATYEVVYVGADVPGSFDTDLVVVANLDLSLQPAQIDAAIASGIRTRASSLGITIGNNDVILCGSVKG